MYARLSDIDRLFGTMGLLQRRLNHLYSDYDKGYGGESMPLTNLYEDGDTFEIRAEVPGIDKNEIHIKIQGNYLEISGTQTSDAPEGYSIHKTERGTASFSRSFTLPADVNSEKVEATLKNGVLYLTLPKSERAKPKQITVN